MTLNIELLPGEKDGIETVIAIAKRYGYGNMISHLRTAWAKELMKSGISENGAVAATNVSAYPLSIKI